MTPIRGLNLKKLFGKLTPYVDDAVRGVSNYGDDALRLASKHGDEALDYGVDLARVVDKYDDNVVSRLRNEAAASNILENAAIMGANASDTTADALTRLNRKYPTVYDTFRDEVGWYDDLAVGPFTDVAGYTPVQNTFVAHAGNPKLKALYEKLGLDRYGYKTYDDELPF